MARYSVAFALPIGTDVSFSEDGWEFKSPAPLSLNVKSEFISKFNLELVECYSGVEKFSVDGLEFLVFYNDLHAIEHIYFKIYDKSFLVKLREYWSDNLRNYCYLFFPGE